MLIKRYISIETPEVGLFCRDELSLISTTRVTEEQIQQFFDYLELILEAKKFDQSKPNINLLHYIWSVTPTLKLWCKLKPS